MQVITRADLLFLDELVVPSRPMLMDELWLPAFHSWGGINDRFAIGSEFTIQNYCSRIADADKWLSDEGGGNAERFLKR